MAIVEDVAAHLSTVTPLQGFAYFSVWFVCWVSYRLWIYPFYLSPLRHIPGPNSSPLFGERKAFLSNNYSAHLNEWIKTYGPVVRTVGPIGLERVFFASPQTMEQILVSGWAENPRPDFLRNILGLVAGYGLLTVTGDVHRKLRKSINPAFSIPNLSAQTDMYFDAIEGLVDIISKQVEGKPEGEKILMYDWMSKVTLDIISKAAFDYETDSLHNPHNELAVAYENLISLQTGRNLFRLVLTVTIPGVASIMPTEWLYRHRKIMEKPWFFFGFFYPFSTMVESMHVIRGVSKRLLDQKLKELSPVAAAGDMELPPKRDIMSILVRAQVEYERQRKSGKTENGYYGMDEKAMVDQVLTFLGAGHETTASGLGWTLYLLATHQDYQDRLREEVSPIFIPGARPEYRELKELPLLDGVVMEALRLLPAVPMTIRKAGSTEYVDGVKVPKGTLIPIPIQAINTSEAAWGPDAEEFRPERWQETDAKRQYSFMSFIAGPHGCIGKTMAISEMRAIIGALVANFVFTPSCPNQQAITQAAITMKPTDGMPLIVKSVKAASGKL